MNNSIPPMPADSPALRDKAFVIYDGRALMEGTDAAAILCVASSLKEARRDARMFGECHIYEYDVDNSAAPAALVNERYVETRK